MSAHWHHATLLSSGTVEQGVPLTYSHSSWTPRSKALVTFAILKPLYTIAIDDADLPGKCNLIIHSWYIKILVLVQSLDFGEIELAVREAVVPSFNTAPKDFHCNSCNVQTNYNEWYWVGNRII